MTRQTTSFGTEPTQQARYCACSPRGIPRLLRAQLRLCPCSDPAGAEEHTENPHSLAGTGALRAVKDAAQALGLRPWLAALPLRERRLRARLLMCAPNGGCQ